MTLVVLLVRTFVAEAYIVPTGSMAPFLLGYHKSTTCPKCQFPVTVGHLGRVSPDGRPEDPAQARRHYALACCPNCGWDRLDLERVPECAGDRLLVHKHIFDLRAPRRWELVVFQHPPSDAGGNFSASDSYIKRLVGLPGETVQVRDGDLYITGHIARKTLREFKEMRVSVYDDDYVPSDAPDQFRWSYPLKDGWRASELRAMGPAEETLPPPPWLSYQHFTRQSETGGRLVWRPQDLKDHIGYNGGQAAERLIHDLFLEGDLEVTGDGWLDLAITDGHDDVLVHIPVGKQNGRAELRHAAAENWASNTGGMNSRVAAIKGQTRIAIPKAVRLAGFQRFHLEFGLVDRRLFLMLGETDVFDGGYDLPQPAANRTRRSMIRPLVLDGVGPLSLGERGVTLRARGLKLYRDVHYTDGDGRELYPNGVDKPVTLGPGEYFVLGDNSGNSYDSRCWRSGPAVRHEWLVGKPFLLHLPTQIVEWNGFGEKRALAVPDWSRMKLLR
jgi:signal peptidase I